MSPKSIEELKIRGHILQKSLQDLSIMLDRLIVHGEEILNKSWKSHTRPEIILNFNQFMNLLSKIYQSLQVLEENNLIHISEAVREDIQRAQSLSDDFFAHSINSMISTAQSQIKRTKTASDVLKPSLEELRDIFRELHMLFSRSVYAFPLTQKALLNANINMGGMIEQIK